MNNAGDSSVMFLAITISYQKCWYFSSTFYRKYFPSDFSHKNIPEIYLGDYLLEIPVVNNFPAPTP